MSNSTAMLPGYGFQDVILELMLVNENLEKVGKTIQEVRDVLVPTAATGVAPQTAGIIPQPTTNSVDSSEKLVERIESVDTRSKEQLDELKKIRGEVYQTNLFMRELLDFFTSKKLQELEDRREFISLLGSFRQKKEIEKPGKLKLSILDKFLLGGLPALLGSLIGVIEGLISSLRAFKLLPDLPQTRVPTGRPLIKPVSTPASKIGGRPGSTVTGRVPPKTGVGKRLPPRGPGGRFKKAGILDDIVRTFTDIADSISNWWKGLIKRFPMVNKIGRWIDDVLKPMWGFVKGVFNFARGLGRFFGKLLLPLQVIMSVIDGVTGFIDGFNSEAGNERDKMVAGLRGGIAEIAKGLIALPLDFLKSAVSWIAGKLGFTELEAALDSFSFANIVDEMKRLGVFDFFLFPIRAVRGFMEAFNTDTEASIVDRLIAGFKQGTMEIFDSILGGFMRIIQKGVVWLAEKFGADQYAAELAKLDPVDEIKKIFYGFVDDIVGFFKGIGNMVTGLFSGEISFIDYLKEGLSAIVTAFLLPIDRFGANITEKILESLNLPKLRAGEGVKLERSFKPKPAPEKKPEVKVEANKPEEKSWFEKWFSSDKPVTAPTTGQPDMNVFSNDRIEKTNTSIFKTSDRISTESLPVVVYPPSGTNLTGSTMTQYIKDTKDAQDKSKLSAVLPMMAATKGGGQTVINTTNQQTSINQSMAVERTTILLNPMFSYA